MAISHALRPAAPSDRNFVASGWARQMRASPFARHVPESQYWPAQHELIDRILRVSSVTVACDPEQPEHLYGCVVFLPGELAIVHWLHVRGSHRQLGVGRALLAHAVGDRHPVYCTQATSIFNDRALVARYDLVYSPYLLFGIGPQISAEKETTCPPPSLPSQPSAQDLS